MALHQYANNPQTALSGGVTAGATAISVASAASFPARGKFTIIVDSEIMLVTGVNGTTWTVVRGHDGTSAAAHNNNALVTQILTVDSFLNAHAYDPRAYGAAGDGTTDDTAALQAALNAAPAGSRIRFPHGATYLVTSPLTISRSLHVEGHGATLKAGADGMDAWFKFTNVTGLSIRGLSFDDDSRGRTIVALTGCADALIEGCRFTGYSSTFGTSSTDSLLRISTSTDVRVVNNVFEDSGNADPNLNRCLTIDDASCNRIQVTNNVFRNVNQAIVVNGTKDIVISGNVFNTVSDNGIYALANVQGLTITGNHFQANEEAIVLSGGAGNPLRNVTITGNTFIDWTNRAIAWDQDIEQVSIVGNVFHSNAGGSYLVRRTAAGTVTGVELVGNVFRGVAGFAAIYFHNVVGLTMATNRLHLTFASANNFLLRIDGTTDRSTFDHNHFDVTGSANPAAIRFVGAVTNTLSNGNTFAGGALWEDGNGSPGVTFRDQRWVAGQGWRGVSRKFVEGIAAPTAGAWTRGDVIFNSDPSASGFIGWVCTATGSPGTWKTFGPISS